MQWHAYWNSYSQTNNRDIWSALWLTEVANTHIRIALLNAVYTKGLQVAGIDPTRI